MSDGSSDVCSSDLTKRAAIVGGGPAGLMAAEALLAAGVEVHLFDAMPSLGRKFLMAGKRGLNLNHSEDFAAFLTRARKRGVQGKGVPVRVNSDGPPSM